MELGCRVDDQVGVDLHALLVWPTHQDGLAHPRQARADEVAMGLVSDVPAVGGFHAEGVATG